MNILYGISATGNGHISRSRILISALKKRGHNITVLFIGRDIKDLFDTEEFEPFIAKKGFTFKIRNGKVQYFSTLLNTNIYNFFYDIFFVIRLCSNCIIGFIILFFSTVINFFNRSF